MNPDDAPHLPPFPVAYRELRTGDVGLVYSSWSQSYHQGAPAIRNLPWGRYKTEQSEVIRHALARGRVVVACEPTDQDVIYGWACGCDDLGVGVLDYVYVTHVRRRHGIARRLIEMLSMAIGRTIVEHSHTTITGGRAASKAGLRHNPFAIVRMFHASHRAAPGARPAHGPGRESDPDARGRVA